jgi:hypothetical protein
MRCVLLCGDDEIISARGPEHRICFVIALSAYLMHSEQGSWSALLPTIDTRICGTVGPLK